MMMEMKGMAGRFLPTTGLITRVSPIWRDVCRITITIRMHAIGYKGLLGSVWILDT